MTMDYRKPNDNKKIQKAFKQTKNEIEKNNEKLVETLKVYNKYMLDNIINPLKELSDFFKQNGIGLTIEELLDQRLSGSTSKIDSKYSDIYNKIDSSDMSDAQKSIYKNQLGFQEEQEKDKAYEDSFLGGATEDMSDEFAKGLQSMIKGYKDFSDVMKDLTDSLADYMIKRMAESIAQNIFSQEGLSASLGFGRGILSWLGGTGKGIGGFLGSIFSKHHSGGVVPAGANYSLPGTQEQLALLKGGERILSPGENANFESAGAQAPVVFNNFNIKAWDSKDVQKYLLENKQLLNSITYDGIKNNNSQLRNMVRNA
ncbi:MAG: hypothetical protein KHX03_06355 [Clostridium sp.]|nr:hypothetical protein [Clostridium sp.]